MINTIAYDEVVFNHPALFNPKFITCCRLYRWLSHSNRCNHAIEAYYTPYDLGSGSPTQWIETSEGHAGYNIITSTRCFQNTGIPCKVYDFGTTSSSSSASTVVYSDYYSVMATHCPIDDYVPVFFIFTTGIACFCINKKYNNINEGISDNCSI